MDKNLELLIELQKIDDSIQDLDSILEILPSQISQHSDSLDAARADHQAFLKNLEEMKKLRVAKERQVEEKEAGVAKARQKLNDIKTNEEYKAALAEIDNLNKAVSRLEDEQLEIMEKLEKSSDDEKKYKIRVEEEGKKFTSIKSEKEAEIEEVKKKREAYAAKKLDIVAGITPSYLKHYEKMLSARQGKAVAELKDGYCTACHQSVMPQVALEIRTGTKIHTCQHCNRFLYIEKTANTEHN